MIYEHRSHQGTERRTAARLELDVVCRDQFCSADFASEQICRVEAVNFHQATSGAGVVRPPASLQLWQRILPPMKYVSSVSPAMPQVD